MIFPLIIVMAVLGICLLLFGIPQYSAWRAELASKVRQKIMIADARAARRAELIRYGKVEKKSRPAVRPAKQPVEEVK